MYNFTDDPTPTLPTQINPTSNDVELVDGPVQGDELTAAFTGSEVVVTIQPPTNWVLNYQRFSNGTTGTLPVPDPGREVTYTFSYEVEDPATATKKEGTGTFKLKKNG